MYKLLVVDDEIKIADGIAHTICWSDIGVSVVDCATDGLEALQKIREDQPDIIITDIKMENMDGLALVDEASRQYPFIKFIVLSGYDDPEYIRKALDLKVFSYLLKPAGEEDLLNTVKQQIKEIEKENQLRDKIKMVNHELTRNRHFFIEQFLHDLLNGKVNDKNELDTRSDLLNISFHQPHYVCVIFSVSDARAVIREGGFRQLNACYLSVEEIIRDIWKGEVWPVHMEQERLIVILGSESAQPELESVIENIDKFLDISIIAATGEPCPEITNIWKSYRQAVLVYEGNNAKDSSGIISLREIPDASGLRFIYPVENENKLLLCCFRDDDSQDINKTLGELFDSMEQQGCTMERMRIELMGFLALFSRRAANMGLDINVVYGCDPSDLYALLRSMKTRESLENWLRTRLESTKTMLQTNQEQHIGTKIAKANQYLVNNFCNSDLSLDVVAQHLQINPSYFSRIYKKETGQNFIEALTVIRMEKAKSLLAGTNKKTADIAMETGYQNSRYFWYIFKKMNGCTPSEYREMHIQNQ